MESNGLISIIVPVYNVEMYLQRCVESLINQSYSNLEIILVNDGSKDNSGLICDRYKTTDSRIKVVHKLNGGLSDARNAGLKIANGSYISFVDSDDWIEPSMIEELYHSVSKSDAEIVVGRRFRAYEHKDKKLESYQTYPSSFSFDSVLGLKYLMSFCGYDMSVCDKLFSRKVLHGITFPYGKTCEDSFTTYKIFSKASKIEYVNKGLYNYYYRENSITRNGKVNETVIEATKEQLSYIQQYHPEINNAAASSYITAYMSVYNEHIVRGINCLKIKEYQSEAQVYLKKALRNECISTSKKMQIILFCFSGVLYKMVFKAMRKGV